ncbi:NlpC/P60 family protein [Sphingobium sp. JS3065]|uniref:NlpC/P60 family protein n=1 Tax=Sphingobium sp. JS3065 TaxID=2970925 RepID=UPI00226538F6|nr:NlpC/P60 family protein [Sphingobium sp. JS3065]UZW55562.1 NlpC/P60 family protein [Sphingobium sp. JS3065]
MVTRAEIVAEARRWIGTPYHEQASVRGRGCDCKGLVVGVARACGLPEAEGFHACLANYGPRVDVALLRRGLESELRQVAIPRPGDVLLLRVRGKPQHLGLMVEGGRMVHCWGAGMQQVVSAAWTVGRAQRELDSAWAFPSLLAAEEAVYG